MNRRTLYRTAAVAGLAALVGGAATLLPARDGDAPRQAASAVRLGAAGGGSTTAVVTSLQARLARVSGDWTAWSALGSAYVQQARLTGDPSYYAKAEAALRRSLDLRPEANADALTGLAALAAARHDFEDALRQADRAVAINEYGAAAYGVRSDALVELGRYDEAADAVDRMNALQPGVGGFTRASYIFELRGDLTGARKALERAAAVASAPEDRAYVAHYRGELEWNAGRAAQAAPFYAAALRHDPSFLPALAGRARVAAARGDRAAALRDYETVTQRLPQPGYLAEYADLLTSAGRHEQAREQHELVRVTADLLAAAGVNVDADLALYDVDHGRPAEGLRAASSEWQRRKGIFVEDAYAWALHAAGRDVEARRHARHALRLGTRSALLHYHLGAIEAALGDRASARKHLGEALRINPHFSPTHAATARTLLAGLGASS